MLERIRTSVTTRAGSRASADKAERASTTSKQYGLEGGKTRRPSHFMFDNIAVGKAGVCVVDADGVLRVTALEQRTGVRNSAFFPVRPLIIAVRMFVFVLGRGSGILYVLCLC